MSPDHMARRRLPLLVAFDADKTDLPALRMRLLNVSERLEGVLGEVAQLRGQCRLYIAQLHRANIAPETIFPHLLGVRPVRSSS